MQGNRKHIEFKNIEKTKKLVWWKQILYWGDKIQW